MTLSGADDSALDRGANAALVGDEFLQFGSATQVDARRWRLSRLWRGRRGSEAAIEAHRPGERFVLIDPDVAILSDAFAVLPGQGATVRAIGIGDGDEGASGTVIPTGVSVLPPPPVHLRAETLGSGDLHVRWIRRSRAGWHWRDGVDVPLAEETEAYRVTIEDPAGTRRDLSCTVAEAIVAVGGMVAPFRIEVRQVGTLGLSRPMTITHE